jgi:hypothetical protein
VEDRIADGGAGEVMRQAARMLNRSIVLTDAEAAELWRACQFSRYGTNQDSSEDGANSEVTNQDSIEAGEDGSNSEATNQDSIADGDQQAGEDGSNSEATNQDSIADGDQQAGEDGTNSEVTNQDSESDSDDGDEQESQESDTNAKLRKQVRDLKFLLHAVRNEGATSSELMAQNSTLENDLIEIKEKLAVAESSILLLRHSERIAAQHA